MPSSPVLRLVEPRAPHSAFRRGLPSAVAGTVIAMTSAVPFLISVLLH